METTAMRVGVIVGISEDRETGESPRYAEVRGKALAAEAAGLDSVWLYDHLVYRFGEPQKTTGTWEVWTLLSALAEATTQAKLGVLVMCVPFRNPAVLAKMADTLDEVSGGRFTLGLGAGWHRPEFDAFGIPFDNKASRFEDGVKIIAPLLREGNVDYRGTYASAPDCELRPRGPSAGGPPILIAAAGPRMLRLTAEHADQWNTAWLGEPSALDEPLAKLHAACDEVGRDRASLAVTVGITVRFPDLLPAPEPDVEAPNPAKVISGTVEDVASALRGYADRGVAEVIVNLDPSDETGFARLAEARAMVRTLV